MVFFIFILLLMFSLSGVLYLMVRALPRVAETAGTATTADAANSEGTVTGKSAKLLDRWAHSDIPEKIDAAFNEWFLKFLRKFKVFTMKLDNMASTHLRKIRHDAASAEKKAAIDFKEIAEKKDED